MKIGFPLSLNITFWAMLGMLRMLYERFFEKKQIVHYKNLRFLRRRVAVCLPAHNEQKGIAESIGAIKNQISVRQVYVVSDGSTDQTVPIVRQLKCHMLELLRSRGKSQALKELIKKFSLLKRYEYIIFVDADTKLAPHYIDRALTRFVYEKDLAAIAAYAIPIWDHPTIFSRKSFIASYRTKLYIILQQLFMYGQTWKFTNVNAVVPGFAAMYPTRILKRLQLATPGIIIEDFDLAFQIHRKNLGWIGHFDTIAAYYHDPITFTDYFHQIRRWNVGFYQTVRRRGFWLSLFWVTTSFFSFENVIISLFVVVFPIVLLLWGILTYIPTLVPDAWVLPLLFYISKYNQILITIIVMDYAFTLYIALRKKSLLLPLYGLGFLIFAFINSWALLNAIPLAFLSRSQRRWIPATRG